MTNNRLQANNLFLRASVKEDLGQLLSAFRLYLAGAKLGDTSCQINLGNFYADGRGIKPNRKAAIEWYKKAYASGERTAASNLGAMFRDEENLKEALFWYERAAKLHDRDACLEVAKILLLNPRHKTKSEAFLKQALTSPDDDVTRAARKEAKLLLKKLKVQ